MKNQKTQPPNELVMVGILLSLGRRQQPSEERWRHSRALHWEHSFPRLLSTPRKMKRGKLARTTILSLSSEREREEKRRVFSSLRGFLFSVLDQAKNFVACRTWYSLVVSLDWRFVMVRSQGCSRKWRNYPRLEGICHCERDHYVQVWISLQWLVGPDQIN